MLSLIVMHLVNWLGGVNDVRLDRLLLNDRLDRLVDVVVHMLSGNGRRSAGGLLALHPLRGVLVLSGFGSKALLHLARIVVLIRPLLRRQGVMMVLLGQCLLIVHWLLSGVVMVLVDFPIDGGRVLIMLCPVDSLLLHRRSYFFVDFRIMLAILGDELLDVSLGCVHYC